MTDNSSSRIGTIQASNPRPSGADETGASVALSVGPATLEEAPQVVDVISAAFHHDPTWSWAFPDPAARRRWWELCTRSALRYPWVLRTSGFEAVSVWIPPDGIELTVEEEKRLPQLLTELVGTRAAEVAELLCRFGEAHPRQEPHYYLSLLATADEHRGRGLGQTPAFTGWDELGPKAPSWKIEREDPACDKTDRDPSWLRPRLVACTCRIRIVVRAWIGMLGLSG